MQYLFGFLCLLSSFAQGEIFTSPLPLDKGFAKIPVVIEEDLASSKVSGAEAKFLIETLCRNLQKSFKKYGWQDDPCGGLPWKAEYKTAKGNPLIYLQVGNGPEKTLFLGGVHPDELIPIPIAFRLARHLASHPEIISPKEFQVVVAPLVNPDGFLEERPLRTNHRVDLNRNFYTLDWYDKALNYWQTKHFSPNYFPGYFPNSEIETIFQIKLLEKFHPHKILSLHAPLGFLDYDGPGDQKRREGSSPLEKSAKDLVKIISQKSKNFPVVEFAFYPGSLGNFAGAERMKPTVTLELDTTNPRKLDHNWAQFLPGLIESIRYKVPTRL